MTMPLQVPAISVYFTHAAISSNSDSQQTKPHWACSHGPATYRRSLSSVALRWWHMSTVSILGHSRDPSASGTVSIHSYSQRHSHRRSWSTAGPVLGLFASSWRWSTCHCPFPCRLECQKTQGRRDCRSLVSHGRWGSHSGSSLRWLRRSGGRI